LYYITEDFSCVHDVDCGMPSDGISHKDTLFSHPQEIWMLSLFTVITPFRKDHLAVLFSLAYLALSTSPTTFSVM